MENFGVTLLVIAGLILGLFGGAIFFPTTEIVDKEVIKEVLVEVEVPGETIEVEVEVPGEDFTLDTAIEEFMSAVEDEEDEAGLSVDALSCGKTEYDFDEISVSRVYDKWSVEYDEEDTTVEFDVKLKYKEDDEKSCRLRYDVTVEYEEDEDTRVTVTPFNQTA